MTSRSLVRIASFALAALAALVLPASAGALTASIDGADLRATAGAGESNELSIETIGTDLRVIDNGAGVTAGAGCAAAGLDGHRVTCPAAGVNRIVVDARDGNDAVAIIATINSLVHGGRGADDLTGGGAQDRLFADAGVTNGFASENLVGGAGKDTLNGSASSNSVASFDGGGGPTSCSAGRATATSCSAGPAATS